MNTRKIYIEGGIYHVYNRASAHSRLFNDNRDYRVFVSLIRHKLCKSLNPLERTSKFYGKIELYAYCLMPTHFHLLLKQKDEKTIAGFMKSLQLSYSHYKHICQAKRGSLYEDRYKARLITSTRDLLTTSRYIHRNPQEIVADPEKYQFSSLRIYTNIHVRNKHSYAFLNTKEILRYYEYSPKMYSDFVKGQAS